MIKRNLKMAEISWSAYQELVASGELTIFLPLGSLEQHGHHLPLNTDVLIPSGLAEIVAQALNGLIAPALPYGYKSQPKSGGGQHFCGTTSIDALTLISTVKDVIKEFARHGVRKIVLLNGHYENAWFVTEGIDLALRELHWAGITGMKAMVVSYWEFITDEVIASLYPDGFPGWGREHAGVMETSIMMSLHPQLVQLDKAVETPPSLQPPYDLFPPDPSWVPAPGTLSSPMRATREKGEQFIRIAVSGIADAVEHELKPARVRGLA